MASQQVPQLKKDNYERWCIQFKALFGSQDVWEIASNGFVDPTHEEEARYTAAQKATIKELRKKDQKALYLLYQGLDEATFEKIAGATTSKAAWDTLSKVFKGVDRVKRIRLQALRVEFETTNMKDGESVSDYHSRLLVLVNDMRRNGETLEDVRVIEKILRSLSPKFEHVVTSIEESRDVENMDIEELLGSLKVHELRIQRNVDSKISTGSSASLEQTMESKLHFGKAQRGGRGRGGRGRWSPQQGRGQGGQEPWSPSRGGGNFRDRGCGRGRQNN